MVDNNNVDLSNTGWTHCKACDASLSGSQFDTELCDKCFGIAMDAVGSILHESDEVIEEND